MSNDNFMHLEGNLTREPELRFDKKGNAVCKLGIAWSPRIRNAEGVFEDGETSFFNAVAFGRMGENVAATAGKGTRVVIDGEFRMHTWTPEPTDEDPNPEPRRSYELVANTVAVSLRWATAEVTKASRSGPLDEGAPVEVLTGEDF